MKRSLERIFKVLFIIIVIMAMAAPQAVLAQDVVPTDAPVEATEVVVEEVSTEAPVVEETAAPTEAVTEVTTEVVTEAPTEVAVETAAPTTEVVVTEAPAVEEDLTEVVELLDTADITIVDENGDALSMGSQEAAEVISNSDPFFWDGTKWVGYTSETGTCPDFIDTANCFKVEKPFTAALSVVPADTTLYVAGGSTYETATNYDEAVEIATSGLSFVGFSGLAAGAGSTSTIDSSLIIPGYAILQQILLKADFGTTLGVYADKVIVWNDLDGVGTLEDGFLNDAFNLVNIGNQEATIEADLVIYAADGYYRVMDANDPTTNFEWESGDSEENLPTGTYHMVLKNPYSEEIIDFYSHEGPDDGEDDINDLMIGATMSELMTLSFINPEDTCPEGSLVAGVCVKTPTCSAGWTYNSSDKLCHENPVSVDPTCPYGYHFHTSDNKCHKSGSPSVSPLPCASGFTFNTGTHKCEKTLAAPIDGNCPTGMVINATTHKCEMPPVPTCPDGTVMNGTTGKCDLPAWSNEDEMLEFWHILGKTDGYTDLTLPIYNYINNSTLGGALALNQVVWFLKPVGLLTPDAQYPGCDSDEVLDSNGNCLKSKYAQCESGWHLETDKLCHEDSSDYRPTTCPSGWTYWSSDHKCHKSGQTAFYPTTCNSGYTYNSSTHKCDKILADPENGTCRSPYTLNKATHLCEKIDGTPYCPFGTVLSATSGKCEKPVTMCGETSYKTLGFTEGCGGGGGDKCKPLSFLKYACPAGQYLFNGKCETPCSYDPSMPASSGSCVPCSYDPTMAADDKACVPCSYDPTIAADSESCVPCSYDPTMAADDKACVPCEFNPEIAATDSACPTPCVFNPLIASTDPACPTACIYNPLIASTDAACVPPVVPVTGATPALAIPVTGGALIPVTGGTLIVSGLGHSCMTYSNGQVICWGLNASGQLGDGTTANKTEAVYVKDLSGVLNLTAGSKHTCALTTGGDIWCWGENSSGQLGNGSTTNSNVPVKVAGLPAKVLSITAGEEFTCAQLMNQEVWCWGKNNLGQLNDGTTTNQTSPVKSKLTAMLAQISGGQGTLLGSDVLGTVNEWVKAQAAAVKELANSLSISANRWGDTGCAVAADGSIKCWGSDLVSAAVAGAVPAIEVGAGLDHNCSINSNESVSCWGSNGSGQLGDGTNKDSSSATLVKNLELARALAVGAHHTCVLAGPANTPMCWGENTFGQLGNSSTANSNLPVLVVLPK